MSPVKSNEVAIVGGGLAGMSLALAFHKFSICSTIHELRPPTVETPGAVVLSPNSLRVLDTLGVYDRIRGKGYNFESLTYMDANHTTIDTYLLGSESKYGYKALRIYRKLLLAELRAMLEEAGIPIHYGRRFSHIISEDENGVTFAFADNSTHTAALLIGADGIHSTVRKNIAGTSPVYAGGLAITGVIPKPDIDFPPNVDYPLPASIFTKPGAFVMAPQNVDGSEIFFGFQFSYPEQDRAGWDSLMAQKPELLRLLQKDLPDWPPLVQSVLHKVPIHTLSIWPFYVVPKLDSWLSATGRVVIVGDAAHAIPPAAGQGANQAVEDTYTLALLLSKSSSEDDKFLPGRSTLDPWQRMRQNRIEDVIALTKKLNNTRLPEKERAKLGEDALWTSGRDGDHGWLYNARMEELLAEAKV